MPAEFEPVDEVVLGWDEEFLPYFRDTLIALAGHARITFVVDPEFDMSVLTELVEDIDVASGLNTFAESVGIVAQGVDSIWMRDFGPLVTQKNDERRIVDLDYWNRGANDQLASIFGHNWLGLDSVEVPLELEGGNLQVDGTGNCLVSTIVLDSNPNLDREQIKDLLRENFGCTRTDLLPPLPKEPTGHVDMFLTFTGPGELIVGQYDSLASPEARQHLELLAEYLIARGYRVRRVPMPDQSDGRFRTYTNSLAVNDVVLVPHYGVDQDDLVDAIRVYAEAYPNRTIIPILASALIELDGAVHCAAMTIPR